MISKEDYRNRIAQILDEDSRYQREVYNFLVMAINYSVSVLIRSESVTAKELLEGIRVYGLERFGPMTKTVMEHWGINSCRDFGEAILNLIKKGVILGPLDNVVEEFDAESFDFIEAFEKPYQNFE